MQRRTRRLNVLLVLSLLALHGWTVRGHAKQEKTQRAGHGKDFHIEEIQQKRTEAIAWLRVAVVARTGLEETWDVLQDIEAWDRFLRLFPRVTAIERTETMTRYRMLVSPPWPLRDFESFIWMAKLPEGHLIFWRSNKDDLRGSHGRIEVEETPGGTRVSYEIHSPVKTAFPKWVVRIGLHLVLPGMAQDFYERIVEQRG
jgi:hypothetical protein